MAWWCLYSYHGEKYGPQDSVDGIQPGDLNGENDLIRYTSFDHLMKLVCNMQHLNVYDGIIT